MDNSLKLAGALLFGATIGVALGVLFAPDKGSELRKKIMNNATDLADEIKSKFTGDGRARAREAAEAGERVG